MTTKQIGENIQSPDKLKVLFNTALYLLQIWYALNAVEIPAVRFRTYSPIERYVYEGLLID